MQNKKVTVPTIQFAIMFIFWAFLVVWGTLFGLDMYTNEIGSDGVAGALWQSAQTTGLNIGLLAIVVVFALWLGPKKPFKGRIVIPGIRKRQKGGG